MIDLIPLATAARKAAQKLMLLDQDAKNRALYAMADQLLADAPAILQANAQDMQQAAQNGMPQSTQDRLLLTQKRIADMAEGIRQVAALPDPVGDTEHTWLRPNGLRIGQVRVPLGVVAMIYEARPNVTSDSAALCFKSGNAVLLRGGKEAIASNRAIAASLRTALAANGFDPDAVCFLDDTDRATAQALMGLTGYVDVLIPRGGAGLIRTVVQQSRVPVIETGTGVCHVYVQAEADFDMARQIIANAKLSRPSVCNAAETLLVDAAIAPDFLPDTIAMLQQRGCTIHGDPVVCKLCPGCLPAQPQDWDTEYGLPELNVAVVNGFDAAVEHIRAHSTRHSECIVTNNYTLAMQFHRVVDAAAVYVNASTRFTDGGEFGFGAEIGISTQKLHARGPVGLRQLTTTKYIIFGDGQVRE